MPARAWVSVLPRLGIAVIQGFPLGDSIARLMKALTMRRVCMRSVQESKGWGSVGIHPLAPKY
jgi:hypothetical protein